MRVALQRRMDRMVVGVEDFKTAHEAHFGGGEDREIVMVLDIVVAVRTRS